MYWSWGGFAYFCMVYVSSLTFIIVLKLLMNLNISQNFINKIIYLKLKVVSWVFSFFNLNAFSVNLTVSKYLFNFFTWAGMSHQNIQQTSVRKLVKEKVLWNTVKWSLSGEQMSTVRLFMQSFSASDCTALSLCHQFISKFFSKCAVSCSVLYFKGLYLQSWEGSFFPAQSNFMCNNVVLLSIWSGRLRELPLVNRVPRRHELNKPELWMLCGVVSWDGFGWITGKKPNFFP